MKLAIAGEEGIRIHNLKAYIPYDTEEIVSTGEDIWQDIVDLSREYGFKLTVFFKNSYYTNGAQTIRNIQIAEYADELVAFCSDSSRKTQHIINCFNRNGKRVRQINI